MARCGDQSRPCEESQLELAPELKTTSKSYGTLVDEVQDVLHASQSKQAAGMSSVTTC